MSDAFDSRLTPLKVDPISGEPFLQLPAPLDNIIITPPRLSDAPSVIAHLNDYNVVQWLQGPPYPYTAAHAETWLKQQTQESDAILSALTSADRDKHSVLVEGCPVTTLREKKEDGTDIMLGDIGIHRCTFPGTEDPEERARLTRENAERKLGDPDIVWCVGGELFCSLIFSPTERSHSNHRLYCKLPLWSGHHDCSIGCHIAPMGGA